MVGRSVLPDTPLRVWVTLLSGSDRGPELRRGGPNNTDFVDGPTHKSCRPLQVGGVPSDPFPR